MLQPATLADLPAFLCAHAEDARAGTGCTVFIAPDGATCGVDVRGGGPATRETDLLKPENMIQAVHGVEDYQKFFYHNTFLNILQIHYLSL